MASACSPWWKRKITYKIPFLYKKCGEGNYHLRWDRLCFCQYNENGHKIIDLKTGKEYDYYDYVMSKDKKDYAAFGKLFWQWFTAEYSYGHYVFEEDSDIIMEMAVKYGLARKVIYDPEKHGEIEDAEPGHEIYWWGEDE